MLDRMGPVARRGLYVLLYEAIGVVMASFGLAVLSSQPVEQTGPVALVSTLVAVIWNFAFNTLFEAWEARQRVRGRSVARRVAHAVGFEGGLTVFLVPLVAWWLDVSLVEAFLYDLVLIVFFLVYTFAFNLAFDHLFGLPVSARG